MKGRNPTKAEQRWLTLVSELGCIVCMNEKNMFSPCTPHHIDGRTKEGAHYRTIGLCWPHHQSDDSSPAYESVHGNRSRFEARYGTQLDLLIQTQELLR